jgi:hypothetical protein
MELRGSLVLNHFPFLSSHEVQNKVEEEVFFCNLENIVQVSRYSMNLLCI